MPSRRGEKPNGSPARIPSRLGEPGSLFSRYKFLQLRLVVVMLLTRTRRELLKRRTIGARIYAGGFLEPRVTRHPLRHRRQPPSHLAESSSCTSFRRLRLLTRVCASSSESPLALEYPKDKYSQCLCDLHSGPDSSRGIATVNLHCIYYSGISSLYVWRTEQFSVGKYLIMTS